MHENIWLTASAILIASAVAVSLLAQAPAGAPAEGGKGPAAFKGKGRGGGRGAPTGPTPRAEDGKGRFLRRVERRGHQFDFRGNPHAEQLHTTERYMRPDLGTLVNAVTIDGSGAYTRPFTVTFRGQLTPNTELMEYICQENQQDAQQGSLR